MEGDRIYSSSVCTLLRSVGDAFKWQIMGKCVNTHSRILLWRGSSSECVFNAAKEDTKSLIQINTDFFFFFVVRRRVPQFVYAATVEDHFGCLSGRRAEDGGEEYDI